MEGRHRDAAHPDQTRRDITAMSCFIIFQLLSSSYTSLHSSFSFLFFLHPLFRHGASRVIYLFSLFLPLLCIIMKTRQEEEFLDVF